MRFRLRLLTALAVAACGGGGGDGAKPVVIAGIASSAPSTSSSSSPLAKPPAASGSSRPKIVFLSVSSPSCGLDADGAIWCWRTGRFERDEPPVRGAKYLALGMSHQCILDSAGIMACSGNNGYGALGDGTEKNRNAPALVVGLGPIAEIGLTYGRSCARTRAGQIFCWGDREFGKVGDGSLIDNVGREKPLAGKAILSRAVSLGMGYSHACAANADGDVLCWGDNLSGECGKAYVSRATQSMLIPTKVTHAKDVVAVAAGSSMTCTIDKANEVRCWGSARSKFLGDGVAEEGSHPEPHVIRFPGPVAEIVLGGFGCARLVDGRVACWGEGEYGQLGDGTKVARATPGIVTLPAKAEQVSLGIDEACARLSDGRIMCWGKEVREDREISFVPIEPAPPKR